MSDWIYNILSMREVVALTLWFLVLKIVYDIFESQRYGKAMDNAFKRVHEHLQAMERQQTHEIDFLKNRIGILENQLGRIEPKIDSISYRTRHDD